MKWFLILWFAPVSLIALWYGLSYHDFGLVFFSRKVHDLTFQMYGDMLGLPPADIPPMLLRVLIVDSLIVLAVAAFRWRKAIAARLGRRRAAYSGSGAE